MKKITASNSYQGLVKKLFELNKAKKEIDKEIKEIKDTLLDNVFGNNIVDGENKYIAEFDDCLVSLQLVAQNRFDSTLFKKEHPDIYEKYTKTVVSKNIKAELKK